MNDKELQKLGRRDLLQLLLDQAKETEQLRADLAAAGERAQEMDETFQRLRERLDEKDAKIREMGETYDRLRDRLNDKDAKIKELTDTLQAEREGKLSALTEMGSIAEAALRLNGIFEAAQRAADLYLEKVHEVQPLPEGAVVADAVIHTVRTEPRTSPFSGPIVDVEPKEAQAPPPPVQQPVQPEQPAYQPQPAQPVYQAQPAQPVQPVYQEPPVQPEQPAYQPQPVQPVQQPQPVQQQVQPAAPAAEKPQKRGLFQKKQRGENKGRFVLSFGWEQE